MVEIEVIDHWLKEINGDIGISNIEKVRDQFIMNSKAISHFSLNLTGVFAYSILDSYDGNRILCELIFYIHPAHRGDLKLVKRYINRAEAIAKKNGCDKVAIGANIGYKDQSFLRLLNRWGYANDTVVKEL